MTSAGADIKIEDNIRSHNRGDTSHSHFDGDDSIDADAKNYNFNDRLLRRSNKRDL